MNRTHLITLGAWCAIIACSQSIATPFGAVTAPVTAVTNAAETVPVAGEVVETVMPTSVNGQPMLISEEMAIVETPTMPEQTASTMEQPTNSNGHYKRHHRTQSSEHNGCSSCPKRCSGSSCSR